MIFTGLKRFLLIAVLCLLAGDCYAAQYYVDFDAGSDAANGTTTGTPWKYAPGMVSASGVSDGTTLAAGDIVSFNKGVTWAGSGSVWEMNDSGTAGSVITYNAYGAGADPIFDLRSTIANSGWTEASGVTGEAINLTWYKTLSAIDPQRVWLDGTEYVEAHNASGPSRFQLDSTERWYYGGSPNNRLIVFTPGEQSPDIEYTTIQGLQRFKALGIEDEEYITIDGLDFRGTYEATVDIENSDNITITGSAIGMYAYKGMRLESQSAFSSNIVISGNTFASGYAFTFEYESMGTHDGYRRLCGVEYVYLYNNTFTDWGHTAISEGCNTDTDGERWCVTDGNSISSPSISYGRCIETRGFRDAGLYNRVSNNTCFDTTIRSQLRGSNIQFVRNLYYDFVTGDVYDDRSQGVLFGSNNTLAVKDFYAFHNTFADGAETGISIEFGNAERENIILKNNLVKNTANDAGRGEYDLIIGNDAGIKGCTYDSNLFWTSGRTDEVDYRGTPRTISEFNGENGNNGDVITGNVTGDPLLQGDYSLGEGSPAIDTGAWLTTITSTTDQVGAKSFVVADASYFYSGAGAPWLTVGVAGDTIRTEAGQETVISSIDYATNTINVWTPIKITKDEGIGLTYNGTNPDMGFVETAASVAYPNGVIDTPTGNVSIVSGGSVNFTATVTCTGDTPCTQVWYFGVGGPANSTAVDPGATVFPTAGVYNVTFTVTDDASRVDPTPPGVQVTVTDTLVLALNCEQNVLDQSGNGNNMTWVGNETYSSALSPPEGSYWCDMRGTGDYLTITDGNQAGLDLSTSFSLVSWALFDDDGGQFLGKHAAAANMAYQFTRFGPGVNEGKVTVLLSHDGTANTVCASAIGLAPHSTKMHLAATFDDAADEVRLYKDGALVTSGDFAGGSCAYTETGPAIYDNAEPFQYGRSNIGGEAEGLYDELFIYNGQVLSAAEISNIYNTSANPGFVITKVLGYDASECPSCTADGTARDNAVIFGVVISDAVAAISGSAGPPAEPRIVMVNDNGSMSDISASYFGVENSNKTLLFQVPATEGFRVSDLEYSSAAIINPGGSILDVNVQELDLTLPIVGGGNSLGDLAAIVVENSIRTTIGATSDYASLAAARTGVGYFVPSDVLYLDGATTENYTVLDEGVSGSPILFVFRNVLTGDLDVDSKGYITVQCAAHVTGSISNTGGTGYTTTSCIGQGGLAGAMDLSL